jgi:sugar/nucleoside kinase (ribokinase family)
MSRIVALGDLTADLVLPVTLPIPAGQSIQVPWYRVEPGGAGNFLIAGARLGGAMYAVGAVGDDLFGRHAVELLRAEGVDISGETLSPDITTTLVTVLFQPDAGQFSYVWHSQHNMLLPITSDAAIAIENADAVFLQGFTFWEKSLRPLVEHTLGSGRPIWFDVGPAAHGISADDRALIARSVYGLMTTEEEFAVFLDGFAEGPQALFDRGVKVIALKRGAAGCRVLSPNGISDVPAFNVPARDLVGAGDSFNAGFLYGIVGGLSPEEAGLLGNACGAAKIQKLGTGRAMPTRAEVEAVLAAGGKSLRF